jgi:hypothetical protein
MRCGSLMRMTEATTALTTEGRSRHRPGWDGRDANGQHRPRCFRSQARVSREVDAPAPAAELKASRSLIAGHEDVANGIVSSATSGRAKRSSPRRAPAAGRSRTTHLRAKRSQRHRGRCRRGAVAPTAGHGLGPRPAFVVAPASSRPQRHSRNARGPRLTVGPAGASFGCRHSGCRHSGCLLRSRPRPSCQPLPRPGWRWRLHAAVALVS